MPDYLDTFCSSTKSHSPPPALPPTSPPVPKPKSTESPFHIYLFPAPVDPPRLCPNIYFCLSSCGIFLFVFAISSSSPVICYDSPDHLRQTLHTSSLGTHIPYYTYRIIPIECSDRRRHAPPLTNLVPDCLAVNPLQPCRTRGLARRHHSMAQIQIPVAIPVCLTLAGFDSRCAFSLL